jgi:hypothetical protein
MKKYFFLLLCMMTLTTACDDGDFDVQNFDFSTSQTQFCNSGSVNNFFLYKINNNEVLIVRFPESVLANPITPTESPRILDLIEIAGNVEVIYRLYDNPLTSNSICTTIPPTSPNVIDEWVATSGKIRIISTVNKSNFGTSSPGANQISGYTHDIEFLEINFLKQNGTEQFYDILEFGNYRTSAVNTLAPFAGSNNHCEPSNGSIRLFKNTLNQVIQLEVPTSLFINEVTPINQPRVANLNDDHRFSYLIFSNNVVSGTYCNTPPTVLEVWLGRTQNLNTTPTIEVTTTQESTGYRHAIVLKNVFVERGNVNFTFGENYNYGSYFTPE